MQALTILKFKSMEKVTIQEFINELPTYEILYKGVNDINIFTKKKRKRINPIKKY